MLLPKLPILSLVALWLAAPAPRQLQAPPDLARAFLRDKMGFSAGEVQAVDAGRAVARQMKTRDPVDVNIFGAVRIDGSADGFVSRLRDIDVLERKLGILQAGKFHDPPQIADLDRLTLDSADAAALERCRPADCELQLSAPAIARFVREVSWDAPTAKDATDRLFRQVLFDRLQLYRASGQAALEAYGDRPQPVLALNEFRLLVAPGDLPVELPDLMHYLRGYPKTALPGATDFFYWNKGDFGMKPTIRMNHVTVLAVDAAQAHGVVRYIVATSQVYADHYFSATLELRTLLEDPVQPGKRFYLFYTTKSRVTGLTGFTGMLIRSLVKSRARSGMERYLAATKRVAEGG